ncbi:hypothetical protein CV102_10200 [Natronococcus pandeyae]|uniref:DUF4352 domain-containing protein n=1 Tax=Natronococcus pandeyae TaxID=2055836 RepID=A0A8J8Q2D5_9EURY|nr:DUF4352 domain-containing protein [Natronococcus pandeyae]TYL38870.1 hypothetical protein CV102_10200 [Natronococcus pandeyae]
MRRRTFVGVAGVSLLGLAGCTGTRSETEPAADSRDDETSQPTTENSVPNDRDGSEADDESTDRTVAVGELVEGDEVQFVVSDVGRRDAFDGLVLEEDRFGAGIDDDDEQRQASDGHEFVVVELAVQNTTDETFVPLGSAFQPVLQDYEEQAYEQVRSVSSVALAEGSLAPGEVERGELAYEISTGRSVSTLTLDDDAAEPFGVDGLAVDLEDEADEIATLEQELRVPVHEFGTVVDHDGLEIAVDQLGSGNNLGPFFEPEDDHEFVVVGITVTNDSGDDQEVSIADYGRLKDDAGWSYPEDPDVLSSLEQFDEPAQLKDGDSEEGAVAYQVEQGRGQLYWTLELPEWDDGKEFWQLR